MKINCDFELRFSAQHLFGLPPFLPWALAGMTSKCAAALVLLLATGALPLVSTAEAASVVSPNAEATVEGNSNNAYPFHITPSQRYQQVYSASDFGALSAGGEFITQIAFRPDASKSGVAFASTLPSIRIDLSTTSASADALSTNFSINVAADNSIVFGGATGAPLSLSSAAAGPNKGPKNFDIIINLTTPFFYNPGTGNLFLDVRNFSGGSTTYFDAQDSIGDPVSRAYTLSSLVGSGRADGLDTAGLITRFTTVRPPPMPTNSISATNCESFPNPPLSVSLVTNSDYPAGTLTVDWFDAATGGNMVAGNTLDFVPPDNAAAGPNSAAFYTYWAQARALSTGATSRSRTPATLTLNPRLTASVSGSSNICLGGSTTIYAALTGIGPWTNSWASNGVVIVTNILTTNLATLIVSPKATTTYTIATLAQSGCSAMPGDLSGSATVTVFALPNDQCAGVIPIYAGANYYINTACATNLGDPTPSCASSASKGVWYGFVPNLASKVTISTCGSDFDTVLAVYTGGCGLLREIACNNDYGPDCTSTSASVSFNSPAFTPYWILAAGYNGSSGNLVIHATECDLPGPAQITSVKQSTQPDGVHVQFCASAFLATSYTWALDGSPLSQTASCIDIMFSPMDDVTHIFTAIGQNNCGSGDSGSAPVTTCSVCLSRGTPSLLTGTTGSGTAPTRTNQCGILSSSTHWYKMIATNDTGFVTLSAETNTALLAVYTGPLTNLIFVGCAPANLPSRVTFNALQYAVYWIAVDQGTNVSTLHLASGFEPYIQNYGLANGSFQLRSSIAPAIPYSLLSSSNLSSSNWSVVLTTNLTTSVPYLYYRETNMMNFPQRYYRLAP